MSAPATYRVRGTSMEPGLREGDVVTHANSEIRRNAVVVFRAEGGLDVKRVVALPGETVEIRGDVVLADGREVVRAFAKERRLWRLGPNELFVLGDNPENSRDSRDYGPVAAERIVGVVTRRASRAP